MSAHDIHGQRVFDSLRPAVQARITASLNAGRWHYAKETLFLGTPLHVRTVPEGDPFLCNHALGTIYVALVNPEDFTAPRDAMIEVHGLQWLDDGFRPDEASLFDRLTVRRDALFGGPRQPRTNILLDPYQHVTDLPHFRYPV